MKLCRFDDDRLGVVEGEFVSDVTDALRALPPVSSWILPLSDPCIAHLAELRAAIGALKSPKRLPLSSVRLRSPVASPGKIIGVGANYNLHISEINADPVVLPGMVSDDTVRSGGTLFFKARSALAGPGDGVKLRFLERRNDHEIELAIVIGKTADRVSESDALDYVAGYAVFLDMTLRGPEIQAQRKSIDSYAVLGPWLTTADEIAHPDALDLRLSVNGEPRQSGNTRDQIRSQRNIVSYASQFFTLYPGDVIFTGTPAGIGPVKPGDIIRASIAGLGEMTVAVGKA